MGLWVCKLTLILEVSFIRLKLLILLESTPNNGAKKIIALLALFPFLNITIGMSILLISWFIVRRKYI